MTTLAAVFVVLVGLGIPAAAFVYIIIKKDEGFIPFMVGGLVFFVSQMMLRMPLLQLLQRLPGFVLFARTQPILYSLLLGLSAGLFEEIGRYIAMRLIKSRQNYRCGLAYGLGHGGLEAGIIGLNYLIILLFTPQALAGQSAGLIATAGLERLFALMLHVGFAVMVMRAVTSKNILWLVLAILLHGLVDGMLGILQHWGVGIFGIELWVGLFALAMLAFTILARPRKQKDSVPLSSPIPEKEDTIHENL